VVSSVSADRVVPLTLHAKFGGGANRGDGDYENPQITQMPQMALG
jgi:hypothetical protein